MQVSLHEIEVHDVSSPLEGLLPTNTSFIKAHTITKFWISSQNLSKYSIVETAQIFTPNHLSDILG